MRHALIGSIVGVLLMASSTFAADGEGLATSALARFEDRALPGAAATTAVAPAVPATPTSLGETPAIVPSPIMAPHGVRRPMLLPALYAGSVGLQAYDAYSTLTVLKHGGREQNPMLKMVVKNPALFVAFKAGITVGTIMAAERLWKDNNRVAAVLLMVGSNSMMALVAANNASVLSRLR